MQLKTDDSLISFMVPVEKDGDLSIQGDKLRWETESKMIVERNAS